MIYIETTIKNLLSHKIVFSVVKNNIEYIFDYDEDGTLEITPYIRQASLYDGKFTCCEILPYIEFTNLFNINKVMKFIIKEIFDKSYEKIHDLNDNYIYLEYLKNMLIYDDILVCNYIETDYLIEPRKIICSNIKIKNKLIYNLYKKDKLYMENDKDLEHLLKLL